MKTRRNFFKAVMAAIAGIPIASTITRAIESPKPRLLVKWTPMSDRHEYLKSPIAQIRREDLDANTVENLLEKGRPISTGQADALAFKKWRKVLHLPEKTEPNMVYCVKSASDSSVKLFVTDQDGLAFPVS